LLISLDWFSLLVLIGSLQGFILFAAILKLKRGNSQTNKFLAFFIFLISVTLLGRFYYTTPNISLIEFKILFVGDLIIFLFGPLLYFYLLKLFSLTPKFKVWFHLIPALVHTIFTLQFLLADRDGFIELSKIYTSIFDYRIIEILAILQLLFYVILNWRTLKKFVRESENSISFSHQIRFYRSLLIIIIASIAAWVISIVLAEFGPPEFSGYLGYQLVWIVLSGSAITLGYYTISNPEIFVSESGSKKSDNNKIENEKIEEYGSLLENTMKNEKPYLEPKLTLARLAELCGISSHQLSKVINEKHRKNFFEYVNTYRVEEFKNLIKDNHSENLTLLAVAYQSGFNSKTTFNTAFKKITNQTPKEYLKTLKAA
jgi:AraC-like DNA-binding protein